MEDFIFTVENGIKVQRRNLLMWEDRLNTKTYNALYNECQRRNKIVEANPKSTGLDIMRGDSLCVYVLNYKLD